MENNKRLKPEEFLEFNQELLGLVRAGVPLPEGLERMGRALPGGKLQKAVTSVHSSLEEGRSLSEALQAHRDIFGDYYASLLKAGETAGGLEQVLLHSTRMARSRMNFLQSLKIASIYPVFVGITCILIGLVVIFGLLPRIQDVYDRVGSEIPLSTRMVLGAREQIVANPWILIVGLLFLAGLWWWIFHTEKGKFFREVTLFYFPLTRRLYMFHLIEEFSRNLGILLQSNVPMEESLALTRANMNSRMAESLTEKMQFAVHKGKPLSSVLDSQFIFPPTINWMVTLCEERGDLDRALFEIAELYEHKREFAYYQFVAMAQPILLVMVGILTGVMLGLFYWPLFELPKLIGMP